MSLLQRRGHYLIVGLLTPALLGVSVPAGASTQVSHGLTKPAKVRPIVELDVDDDLKKVLVLDGWGNERGGVWVYLEHTPRVVQLQRKESGSWVDLKRVPTQGEVHGDHSWNQMVWFVPKAGINTMRVLSPADRRHRRAVSPAMTVIGVEPVESSPELMEAARARSLKAYNAERAEQGLAPLAMNDELNAIAQEALVRSVSLARYEDRLAAWESAYDVFRSVGYWATGYCGGGTDAALDTDGSEPTTWTAGIDDKILEPGITHVGVGVYRPARSDQWTSIVYPLEREAGSSS